MDAGTMGQVSLEAGGAGSQSPVITVDELAVLLRVERKTAYAAVMRGDVPGVRRLGRCIRISREAVMRAKLARR
jgi:excisionase family DNA binding protein